MRIFLLLFLAFSSSVSAQHYTSPEMLPPTLNGGNSALIVVHNDTSAGAYISFQSGSWFVNIAPGETREVLLPNGWSGYLILPGRSSGLRDYLGSQCDGSKPFIRHIYCYQDNSSNYAIVGLPGVNLSNPWDDFTTGILAGVAIAFSIAGLRVWRRAFSSVSTPS